MYLKTNHPKFDLAMELLASLAPPPHTTPLALLCDDLGLDTQKEATPLIGRLKRYNVTRVNSGESRSLRIGALNWRAAYIASSAYLNEVYGAERGTARTVVSDSL